MNRILLSIIIPFYNVEKYISACLDSVFNQDIPLSEYEVICVNDASPDNSREIVLKYMERYPNLILIEHDKNKKLGAARNTGRRIAKGKYIWNVDSDDMIASNCLMNLLSECENNQLDILLFNYCSFNGDIMKEDMTLSNSLCTTGLDFISEFHDNNISKFCSVWKQIYNKSFLDRHNLYSPEINMGEDVPFSFSAMALANKVKSIHDCCYKYRINENSLTGKKYRLNAYSLYEKSFVNARMIYDVQKYIPKEFSDISMHIRNVAKFTLNCSKNYQDTLSDKEYTEYKKICRHNLFNDIHIAYSIMSKRDFIRYIVEIVKF